MTYGVNPIAAEKSSLYIHKCKSVVILYIIGSFYKGQPSFLWCQQHPPPYSPQTEYIKGTKNISKLWIYSSLIFKTFIVILICGKFHQLYNNNRHTCKHATGQQWTLFIWTNYFGNCITFSMIIILLGNVLADLRMIQLCIEIFVTALRIRICSWFKLFTRNDNLYLMLDIQLYYLV